MKDGINYKSYYADLQQCNANMHKNPLGVTPPMQPQPTTSGSFAGGVTTSFVGGLARGFARGKKESEFIRVCMGAYGYTGVQLNQLDRTAYNSAKSEAAKTTLLRRVNKEVQADKYQND